MGCFGGSNNSCLWIILILILVCCCGCGSDNNCGCGNALSRGNDCCCD